MVSLSSPSHTCEVGTRVVHSQEKVACVLAASPLVSSFTADWNAELRRLKVGFHFGEFGRTTKRWPIRACAAPNQAENERLLVNARSVLEVESRSTFSRPERAKTNQIASFQC